MKTTLKALIGLICLSTFTGAKVWADDPGVTKDKIVIGQSTPMTGPVSNNGKNMQAGSKLVFDKINASGGINGRKIENIAYDDGYEPQVATQNLEKLINEDKVFAIFQHYGSPAAKAALPTIEKTDVPFFAPIAASEELRVPVRKNVFTVRESSTAELNEIVDYVIKKFSPKTFSIVSQQDAMGSSTRLAAISAIHKVGKTFAVDKTIERNTDSVDGIVDELIKAKADVVVMAAQTVPFGNIIKKAHEKGYNPIYVGNTTYLSNEFANLIKEAKPKMFIGHSIPYPRKANSLPIIQDLFKDAKAAGLDADGNGYMMEGYLNAKVFVEALKKAGPNLTRDSLRSALESMNNANVGGVKLSYSKDAHRGVKTIYMSKFSKDSFDKL